MSFTSDEFCGEINYGLLIKMITKDGIFITSGIHYSLQKTECIKAKFHINTDPHMMVSRKCGLWKVIIQEDRVLMNISDLIKETPRNSCFQPQCEDTARGCHPWTGKQAPTRHGSWISQPPQWGKIIFFVYKLHSLWNLCYRSLNGLSYSERPKLLEIVVVTEESISSEVTSSISNSYNLSTRIYDVKEVST